MKHFHANCVSLAIRKVPRYFSVKCRRRTQLYLLLCVVCCWCCCSVLLRSGKEEEEEESSEEALNWYQTWYHRLNPAEIVRRGEETALVEPARSLCRGQEVNLVLAVISAPGNTIGKVAFRFPRSNRE